MNESTEREALILLLERLGMTKLIHEPLALKVREEWADAILASDVWRNRQEEAVSERHTFATDACVTRECDCATRPAITDEMVERGLKVSREFPMKRELDNARNVMRAVLEAALNPETTNHENGSK